MDQTQKTIEEVIKDVDLDDSSFLDKLGLDEDELSYAKYQWEKSQEEDRKRGIA